MTETQETVLRALAGQTPGYLAAPTAAAFIGPDFDGAEETEATLAELETLGFAEFTETVMQREVEGDPGLEDFVADVGWQITAAGLAAIA